MWLFTACGFFSVVQVRDEPDKLLVRARSEADLESLRDLIHDIDVICTPNADYMWRAVVDRDEWVNAVGHMTEDIDYDNYKDAVKVQQGLKRASLYGRVWTVMRDLQAPGAGTP